MLIMGKRLSALVALVVVVSGVGGFLVYTGELGLTSPAGNTDTDRSHDSYNTAIETDAPTKSSGKINESMFPDYIIQSNPEESQIFQSHSNFITGKAIVSRMNHTVTPERGNVLNTKTVARHNDTNTVVHKFGSGVSTTDWSNGSLTYTMFNSGTDGSRYSMSGTGISEGKYTFHATVKAFTVNSEYTHTGYATINGTPVAVLTSDSVKKTENLPGRGEIAKYNTTIYVSPNGVVKYIDYSLVRHRVKSDNSISHTGIIAFGPTGETVDVSRPGWVAEAQSDAVAFTHTKTESYVSVTLKRGEPLPKGTTIRVDSGAGRTTHELSSELKTGETFYVYKTNGLVMVSRTIPSGESNPVSHAFITGHMNGTLFIEPYGFGKASP